MISSSIPIKRYLNYCFSTQHMLLFLMLILSLPSTSWLAWNCSYYHLRRSVLFANTVFSYTEEVGHVTFSFRLVLQLENLFNIWFISNRSYVDKLHCLAVRWPANPAKVPSPMMAWQLISLRRSIRPFLRTRKRLENLPRSFSLVWCTKAERGELWKMVYFLGIFLTSYLHHFRIYIICPSLYDALKVYINLQWFVTYQFKEHSVHNQFLYHTCLFFPYAILYT